MVDEDDFILSEWYHDISSKYNPQMKRTLNLKSEHITPVDVNRLQYNALSGPNFAQCFICDAQNPEYMSTNSVQNAAPVPVCSLACESAYLSQRGYQIHRKKKRKSKAKNLAKCLSQRQNRPQFQEIHEQLEFDRCPKQQESILEQEEKPEASMEAQSWWIGALEFYDYVYQRHGMWHSYAIGDNDPKVDPLLTQFWTCNIYRELDRSTAYLRKYILIHQQKCNGQILFLEVLWMSVVLRFCDALQLIHAMGGIPMADEFSQFANRLPRVAKRDAVYARESKQSVKNLIECLQLFHSERHQYANRILACVTLRQVFELLCGFKNNALGTSACWQVTADLVFFHLLPNLDRTDDFVWLSEEAKHALTYIFGQHRVGPCDCISLSQILYNRQKQGFQALNVTFPYFQHQSLTLINIAHSLHGFQQYRRIKAFEAKRTCKGLRFSNELIVPRLYISRSYILDSESCAVCSKSENDAQLLLCDLCNRLYHKYCLGIEDISFASWICTQCQQLSGSIIQYKFPASPQPQVIVID